MNTALAHIRRWSYLFLVVTISVIWLAYMTQSRSWFLFDDLWLMSVTMMIGSFVAGGTPQGGASVAFPVFTKVLHISSTDARTFGLMIQSFGMTMASVVIVSRGVKILPGVIGWVSFGGVFGMVLGSYFLVIPNPYPKVLFTLIASVFGLALIVARWGLNWSPRQSLPAWNSRLRAAFFGVGLVGGAFASITGSGADMLTFIVLTLAFGIDEKISTPTTVVIMGLNSVAGFFLHGAVLGDVGVAWNYWLVCLPIVILGAPLGAYVASRVKRDHIIKGVLFLIGLELATTLWLIPFTPSLALVTLGVVSVCVLWFAAMLSFRYYRLEKTGPAELPGPIVALSLAHNEFETL